MPEVVHPLRALQVGLGLRHLVVVVGEFQVLAAGVDVQVLAVDVGGHHGALDVPAWSAGAPLALPCGLAGLGLLPQREVVGVSLLRVLRSEGAFALLHLLRGRAHRGDELPVVVAHLLKSIDVEVDAAGRSVGDAELLQLLDVLLDPPVHVRGDPRDDVGPQDPQGVHVLEVLVLVAPGVPVEDRVVGDRVSPLLVELRHEGLAAGGQHVLRVAGGEGLGNPLAHFLVLAQL
mmetsp:Transcript_30938/g.90151  ORF Transcript_30938/g.90151 Transcript_30938/m.90151 type:complete len:232 (-) Transcript_30938:533-1228(-)